MSSIWEPQILVTERATANESATYRKLFSSLADEYDENTGFGTYSYPDGTSDSAISFGTISKGKLFILSSDQDISLKLNGSAVATPALRFFLIVADEATGLTSISISNASGSTAVVEMLLAGDITT